MLTEERVTWKAWLPALTIGGALWLLYRQRVDVRYLLQAHFDLPNWFFTACLAIALFLTLLGLTLILLFPVRCGLRVVYDWLLFRLGFRKYRLRCARNADLQMLHALWTTHFGPANADLDRVKRWYRKNHKLFFLLYLAKQSKRKLIKDQELVASFSLIPVTADTVRLLEHAELSGADLDADHIAPVGQPPAGAYIGGVLASRFRARGEILRRVQDKIEELHDDGLTVYARPVTRDGLRLVRKHNFRPLQSEYLAVQLNQVCRLAPLGR